MKKKKDKLMFVLENVIFPFDDFILNILVWPFLLSCIYLIIKLSIN